MLYCSARILETSQSFYHEPVETQSNSVQEIRTAEMSFDTELEMLHCLIQRRRLRCREVPTTHVLGSWP